MLREINFANKALSLTMKQGIDIGPLELVSESYEVGAMTNYTLSFTTPVPLISQARVYITIPLEIEVPAVNQFTVKSLMNVKFRSSLVGNRIAIIID
jgi:hypothetical protein